MNQTITITQTTKDKNDGDFKYQETTWTAGPYKLTLISAEDNRPEWELTTTDRDYPGIWNTASWRSTTAEYGVNWSAMGTKTADEARDYAQKLMTAASVADAFTQIQNDHN